MTETELIGKIQSGDADRFIHIVDKYQAIVFRTCLGFTHHKDDADDLTQEVFVKAYQSIQSFRGQSAFSTWLYRIAVNTSLNHIRNNNKRSIFVRFDSIFGGSKSRESAHIPINFDNPEQIIISSEHKKLVKDALDALPEKQRTAIVLSKYDDLSQKEIAQIMETSEGAVEALIQRAKTNLREKLWKYRERPPE